MNRRLLIVVCCCVAGSAVALPASADGPPQGISQDGSGLTSPDGKLRYLALSSGRDTIVEALSTRDGTLVTDTVLHGVFALPAIGRHASGLSRDGKTLVLTTYPWLHGATFVLLRGPYLDHKRVVTLEGAWSFDAISPHGRTLYLIQTVGSDYKVRAYDLRLGRLMKRVIADRREKGPMTGSAVTRATTRDGSWAYTLYTRPNGTGFVHALDTVHRTAVCVDLPWKDLTAWSYDVRLWVSRDGRTLHLRQAGAGGRWAVIDTRSWRLTVSSPL